MAHRGISRSHHTGGSNGDLYGSAFENGAKITAAIVKMREDRAAQALKEAQQQALQQRYLQAQAAAGEQRQYSRGRDILRDKRTERDFAYRQQKDQAAARAKMGPPQPTPAEAYRQTQDVSANRYLNERNAPAAAPVGFSGNRTPEAVQIATDARAKYFSDHPSETPGPAQPFTGGVAGFNEMQKERMAAEKGVETADTGYGGALAKFPGVPREFLDTVGEKVPYELQYTDPKTKQPTNYPPNQVAIRLPATLDNPSTVVGGARADWLSILAARAKLASMQQQRQALPKGYPETLPQPIAEHYPAAERPMMMPNAPQLTPAVGQRAPYQEPPLPTKEAPVAQGGIDDLIPIINPNGQRGRIPKANVDAALAAGWTMPEE